MKRFTKVALIIAVVFLLGGMFCLIGSVALGLTWGGFKEMVNNGTFNFGSEGNSSNADSSTEEISAEVRKLDIQFGAGELQIKYQDVETIQVAQLDVPNYECYVKEGTLHVEGGMKRGVGNSDGVLIITLPNYQQFEDVDIELGAGKATVERLNTKEFDVEVGAGQLIMSVLGEETDYNYEVECGVGTIAVGNSNYSGLGYEKEVVNPGATRHFSVECGAGSVQIKFEENSL